MVTGGAAVGVWCEEVEEEGAPAVRACRRSRFVAQYRAHPLQSSFPVRVRGLCIAPFGVTELQPEILPRYHNVHSRRAPARRGGRGMAGWLRWEPDGRHFQRR